MPGLGGFLPRRRGREHKVPLARGEAPLLTLVIPVYQEAHRIAATLRAAAEYLEKQPYGCEIVVADDGSSDGGFEAACEAARSLPLPVQVLRSEPNRGKGAALKLGFAASHGEIVAFTDADLATPLDAIELAVERCRAGSRIVIGSRKLDGARIVVRQPWLRHTLGKGFTALVRVLVTEVSDVTCGFKAFEGETGRALFRRGRLYDWSFDAEILFLAARDGVEIDEVPVQWSDQSGTKVRLIGAIAAALFGIIRIRTAAWSGRYASEAPAIPVAREWSNRSEREA